MTSNFEFQELETTLECNRLCHRMLSEYMDLDDFDDLLAEVYENFTTLMLAQNGRINIPDDFMEHAQITREDREVIFVGKGQSITLWNERIYREIKQSRKPLREMFRERLGNNSEND